jgi:hypothetical protein
MTMPQRMHLLQYVPFLRASSSAEAIEVWVAVRVTTSLTVVVAVCVTVAVAPPPGVTAPPSRAPTAKPTTRPTTSQRACFIMVAFFENFYVFGTKRERFFDGLYYWPFLNRSG